MNALAWVEAQTGCRFITNASTGFHVHVGDHGTGKKIPLQTVKNVLMLATAFERCFDALHTSNRIPFPRDHCINFCHALLSFFHEHNSLNPPTTTLFDWLSTIDQEPAYAALGQLFALPGGEAVFPGITEKPTYGHNSEINIENPFEDESIDRYAEHLTGTLEFRQHAVTLEFVEIAAWVSLAVRLVDSRGEASDVEVLALCAQGVDRG